MKRNEKKNVPLIKPRGGAASADSLADASPVELADALEGILLSMDEGSYDPELIDTYLDALEQKAPMAMIPNAAQAQADFLKQLGSLRVQEAAQRTAPRSRKHRKFLVTVAATMATLLALMIGVQAAGIDIFGNLARWTDETFHFVLAEQTPEVSPYYAPLRQALEDNGLPGALAPTWFPAGFETQGPEVERSEHCVSVFSLFQNEAGERFTITISQWLEPDHLDTIVYEKDKPSADPYTSGDRRFYILPNVDDTTLALWSQGEFEVRIIGKLSVEQIKRIIDSIGGQT